MTNFLKYTRYWFHDRFRSNKCHAFGLYILPKNPVSLAYYHDMQIHCCNSTCRTHWFSIYKEVFHHKYKYNHHRMRMEEMQNTVFTLTQQPMIKYPQSDNPKYLARVAEIQHTCLLLFFLVLSSPAISSTKHWSS